MKIKIGLDNNLGTSPEVGINVVETRVGTEDSSLGMFQEIEEIDQNQSPGLDQAPMYVQIGIALDVLGVVSMIILQENAPS